jgi:hypothetical protein
MLLPGKRHGSLDRVGQWFELQLRGVAVEHVQALAAVAKPNPFTTIRSQDRAGIAHGEVYPVAVTTHLDLDPHGVAAALDAVFEGVLQQRLQEQGRTSGRSISPFSRRSPGRTGR